MHFDLFTATICGLGWLSHFFLDWSEAWRTAKINLASFVTGNPPALLSSVTSTIMLYVMGPSILPVLGIQLPPAFDDHSVQGVVAALVGYNADSILTKLANIFRGKS